MRASHSHRKSNGLLLRGLLLLAAILGSSACAGKAAVIVKPILEEGRNSVAIVPEGGKEPNSHPVQLTPTEVATLLHGVRVWERRNLIYRLAAGEAPRTRAFRDDEIQQLAKPVSEALATSSPHERVTFHLSRVTEAGEEETTAGWIYVREPILYLGLSEVHDRHAPIPDISKYDRRMPDVPEQSAAFNVIFEPEEYLVEVVSAFRWWSAAQEEEVRIRYRKALPVLTPYPLSADGNGGGNRFSAESNERPKP
jgi:hypothetical protein